MVQWRGFAKVWLWLCLVVNILALIAAAVGAAAAVSMGLDNIPLFILVVLAEVVYLIGLAILMFGKKKMGFFVMVAGAGLAVVTNALVGQLVSGIVSAVIGIAILFFAIKGYWDDLD